MRIAISKKLRFEIFKRDSFKCQYCGESAPDVQLHIDHIVPIAEGGDNDITNLITSCAGCNLGKGANKLDDNSVVNKQKQQLDALNERRQQLEMLMEWRKELLNLEEDKFEFSLRQYREAFKFNLTDVGCSELRKLIKKFPYQIVLESIDAAANQYLEPDGKGGYTFESAGKAFQMIGRICAVKKRQEENPELSEAYYIRGILKNRFSYWYDSLNYQTIDWLKHASKQGVGNEQLKDIAKLSKNWTHFRRLVNEAIEGLE